MMLGHWLDGSGWSTVLSGHTVFMLFSNIAADQAHEQENVKGDSGATRLFQDKKSLQRQMIARPEIPRLTDDLEQSSPVPTLIFDMKHHE